MAAGDIFVFNQTKLDLLNGTHDLDSHIFKVAILNNTTTPTVNDVDPALNSYTEVGSGGTYIAGGTTLTMTLQLAGGTVTWDSTLDPAWNQNAGNDIDAYWGLIYNTSATNRALLYIDLGGPVDMTGGTLTLNWNANGILTLT